MSLQQLQQAVLALPPAEQRLFLRWVTQLEPAAPSSADVLREGGECPIWSPYGCAEAGEALLAALKEDSGNA
jgi:hypothetical protein